MAVGDNLGMFDKKHKLFLALRFLLLPVSERQTDSFINGRPLEPSPPPLPSTPYLVILWGFPM